MLGVADGQSKELSTSRYGQLGAPAWSPDGKWVAYSKPDVSRNTDIFLVPAAGGEEKKVTFDSFSEAGPRFSPDGRKLYFLRNESTQTGQAAGQPTIHIYSVALERLERDPDDPEERAEAEAAQAEQQTPPAAGGEGGGAPGGMRRQTGAQRTPPKPVNIDWAGLKRRTRQLTRMPFPVTSFEVAPDSRTIVFVDLRAGGAGQRPRHLLDAGGRPTPDAHHFGHAPDGRRRPGRPAAQGGGGVSNLNLSRDGRTLFFQEGDFVYSVAMPPPAPAGGGSAGAAQTAAARRQRAAAADQLRGEGQGRPPGRVGRDVRRRLADDEVPLLRREDARDGLGRDARQVRPLVEYVGDRQELLNIVNEMIGELNASHTGAAPPPGGREPNAVSTGHLGLDLEPDSAAGRYRVTHVYEDGPADKDWVKVSVGDYLIAIDGKPVKAGDEYWSLLNHRLNRKVALTFNSKPAPRARGARASSRPRWATSRSSATSAGSRSAARQSTNSRAGASATSTSRR